MSKVDQFESAFRSAAKQVFTYQPIVLERALIVTDRYSTDQAFSSQVKTLVESSQPDKTALDWGIVSPDDYDSIGKLLAIVEARKPDLIATHRCLDSDEFEWSYTLGEYLDVLTQTTIVPVLVLPHPKCPTCDPKLETDTVMAMTDHMTGDDRLVNYAVEMTQPDGTLFLTHIEDETAFERYMDTISKIPTIETEPAREAILQQLLKEPRDYIASCRDALQNANLPIRIEPVVGLGDHLHEYEQLIATHDVDLLVFNTKDHGQSAMHGLAYPLAVELRDTPLLML